MSNLWTFSPCSEPYLQRCIAAAPTPDLNNKWFLKFGKKDSPISLHSDIIEKTTTNLENNSSEVETEAVISNEDFLNTIKSESTVPVELLIQECSKNPALITKIAEKLSTDVTERLFKQIFTKKDLETEFITTFITGYLLAYIKCQYSRLCNDLLVKTNEEYPLIFNQLLQMLINDTEIPNQVLNNYIAVLNEGASTNLIKTLASTHITSDGYAQNVSAIYTAYKNCDKNDAIQNYIENMIFLHSESCAEDRNFGRMFLLFLQTEKSKGRRGNIKLLEESLQIHRSPFKRPCSMVLEELSN